MLSRGYELLPIIDNTPAPPAPAPPQPPSPITHILDAREFIENHLLAVCQNPIGLAEVYDPTVLRAHSWGYTLGEILFAIFANNVDEDGDMHHSRTTLHNHGGVEMSMQRQGRSFTKGSGASIVEEFVGSAYLIGMKVDEIRDLCYAHGFDVVDVEPVRDVLVRLGVGE